MFREIGFTTKMYFSFRLRSKKFKKMLKSFRSKILSLIEDYYCFSVVAVNTSAMIAISIFMKVIYKRKVPNAKRPQSKIWVNVPLLLKFSKSNSPSERRYMCMTALTASLSK